MLIILSGGPSAGRRRAWRPRSPSRSSRQLLLNLGWFYLAFGAFVIVGASNAVNFTDGLDGLAIVPVMIAAAAFGLIAYLVGNFVFADYLQLHFVPGRRASWPSSAAP